MKKSQSSLEMIFLLVFLLLIFVGIFYFIRTKTQETREETAERLVGELSKSKGEIGLACFVADSYTKGIRL